MKDSPSLRIVDANILIDLHGGGLLREFFRLPFRLVAPDVIIAELQDPDGEMLVEHGLESAELAGDKFWRWPRFWSITALSPRMTSLHWFWRGH